ncbi:MAG: polysaccharide deacetylase family protein [Thermoleophilia bacterium]
MLPERIVRFLLFAFIAGAALGLVGGLVLGGPKGHTAAGSDPAPTSPSTTAAAAAEPMTPERARAIGANELGNIMVLEYHKIGAPATEWTRTPDEFQADLDLLRSEGFYPINLRDLATGSIEVPAGKSPVVITFDDSSPGQYRILEDETLDPQSGVGIIEAAVRAGDWASRATFFVLLDVQPNDHVLFGQKDYRTRKVRSLVKWGYEVGSHTVTHLNLKKASATESAKQLAVSKATIEEMAGGGYSVETISVPFGEYPADDSLLAGGQWEGKTYRYLAAVEVTGGAAPSPFSTAFSPLHIPRIIVTGDALRAAIQRFKDRPGSRYVSDGDPAAVSLPAETAEELGSILPNLGRPVITY